MAWSLAYILILIEDCKNQDLHFNIFARTLKTMFEKLKNSYGGLNLLCLSYHKERNAHGAPLGGGPRELRYHVQIEWFYKLKVLITVKHNISNRTKRPSFCRVNSIRRKNMFWLCFSSFFLLCCFPRSQAKEKVTNVKIQIRT